jgi:Rrf2 family protein
VLKTAASVDYGVRALVHLARKYASGESVKASEIAAAQGIPLSFLERLLARLHRAGLIVSLRGATGGHRLARAPESIQVLEAVEALSTPAGRPGAEEGELTFLWERCEGAWREELLVSLAEVAAEVQRRERNYTYEI